jgi:hypothetical protein
MIVHDEEKKKNEINVSFQFNKLNHNLLCLFVL